MRSKSTWILLFFLISAGVVATVINFALRDLFVFLQVNNMAILGEGFRLSTLLSVSVAILLAVFLGVFHKPSRGYIEQCVIEFSKVAFPEWRETKTATFTVVMVSLIASVILGVFDGVFSWLTNNNLFIW